MERETAGDPISGLKWTRKTTDKIARQLKRLRITVGRNTVGRLLRQMKFSLRTNRKRISAGSTSDRDRQFRYLCRQRNQFEKRGDPVLSVDAKKRELIRISRIPALNGSEPPPTSTITTSVPPPKASAFRMASMIRRPTVARFSWELPMKHLPSPFPASASGGYRRVASATRNPATSSSSPTQAAAMAPSVAPGSKRFNVNCAMAWVCA